VGEVQKGLVNYGGSVGIKNLVARKWLVEAFEHNMPSAASSFLLLRFLCRYKENDVAVGQPRRFKFYPLSAKNQQKKKSD
jgi:hypothetical protein